jgi:hypothetical protein
VAHAVPGLQSAYGVRALLFAREVCVFAGSMVSQL